MHLTTSSNFNIKSYWGGGGECMVVGHIKVVTVFLTFNLYVIA